MISALKSVLSSILNPTIKLNSEFPWTIGKVLKVAAGAEFYFIFPGLIISLSWSIIVLGSLIIERVYGVPLFSETVQPLYWNDTPVEGNSDSIFPGGGHVKLDFFIGMMVLSTLLGFLFELWYIFRCMHDEGIDWRKAIGLNLSRLKGSIWEAFWYATLCLLILYGLDSLMSRLLPEPVDLVAQIIRKADGLSFLALALIAIAVAPVLEEVIFRGFLFNALRSACRSGWVAKLLGNSAGKADFVAIFLSASIFGSVHMLNAFIDARYLWCLPSMIVCGMLLAELFRRTGSLIPGIALHAVNNAAIVTLIALGW